MGRINSVTISGIITSDIETNAKTTRFVIEQEVGGAMLSDFTVLLEGDAHRRFAETGVEKGSEVLLINAVIYKKDGETRLKVSHADQITDMTIRNSFLDKGSRKVSSKMFERRKKHE